MKGLTQLEFQRTLYAHANSYNNGKYTCANHYARANKLSKQYANKVRLLAETIKSNTSEFLNVSSATSNQMALDGLETLKHAIRCGETKEVLIAIIEKIEKDL